MYICFLPILGRSNKTSSWKRSFSICLPLDISAFAQLTHLIMSYFMVLCHRYHLLIIAVSFGIFSPLLLVLQFSSGLHILILRALIRLDVCDWMYSYMYMYLNMNYLTCVPPLLEYIEFMTSFTTIINHFGHSLVLP